MDIAIRITEHKDIESILEMEQESFSFPHTREQLENEVGNPIFLLLTAAEKERVLGYAGLMHVADEGYITNVVVDRTCRRCGIANLLLEEIEKKAVQMKLSFISLEVRESNYSALQLYLKNGYEKKAALPAYYQKPKEDGVIMTKKMVEGE